MNRRFFWRKKRKKTRQCVFAVHGYFFWFYRKALELSEAEDERSNPSPSGRGHTRQHRPRHARRLAPPRSRRPGALAAGETLPHPPSPSEPPPSSGGRWRPPSTPTSGRRIWTATAGSAARRPSPSSRALASHSPS